MMATGARESKKEKERFITRTGKPSREHSRKTFFTDMLSFSTKMAKRSSKRELSVEILVSTSSRKRFIILLK